MYRKIKQSNIWFQFTESKIGHKSQTSLRKNIFNQGVQENSVDKGGTIICLQLYPKIPGVLKRRTVSLNFIEKKETNGKTSQNSSLEGNKIFNEELTMT